MITEIIFFPQIVWTLHNTFNIRKREPFSTAIMFFYKTKKYKVFANHSKLSDMEFCVLFVLFLNQAYFLDTTRVNHRFSFYFTVTIGSKIKRRFNDRALFH